MKQYEGLFILDTDTSGATVDDIIKAIGELIKEAGGNVTNEQKLDDALCPCGDKKQRRLLREPPLRAGSRSAGGFKTAFKREDVFRTQITLSAPVPPNPNPLPPCRTTIK